MKRLIYLKNWQSLDLLVSPLKNCRHTISIVYVTQVLLRHVIHSWSLSLLEHTIIALRFSSNNWWRFTVGCRIIVYVLNGAVPSNVKRMSLIFKISKIKLEYVAIFLAEIPQSFQRRHRGFLAFLTYDVTEVSSD